MKNDQKKKRPVSSFEADPDVEEMILALRSKGYRMGWVINEAMRRFGPAALAQSSAEIAKETAKLQQIERKRKGRRPAKP